MKKLIFHHLPSKISSSHQRPLLQICTTHRVPELRTNVLSFGKPNARTPQRDALIFTGCLKLLSMVSDIIDSNSHVLHMFASLATVHQWSPKSFRPARACSIFESNSSWKCLNCAPVSAVQDGSKLPLMFSACSHIYCPCNFRTTFQKWAQKIQFGSRQSLKFSTVCQLHSPNKFLSHTNNP